MKKKEQRLMFAGAGRKIFDYARELRKSSNEAEDLMWKHLRNRKLRGLKFRRQHPLAGYIADFYCHEKKLAIELDGEIHNETINVDYDIARTYELNEYNVLVVRFTNDKVLTDIDSVLNDLKKLIDSF